MTTDNRENDASRTDTVTEERSAFIEAMKALVSRIQPPAPTQGIVINYDDILAYREFFSPEDPKSVTVGHITMFALIYNLARRMGATSNLGWIGPSWAFKISLDKASGAYTAKPYLTFRTRDASSLATVHIQANLIPAIVNLDRKLQECDSESHGRDERGRLWWILRIQDTPHCVSIDEANTLDRFYEHASQVVALASVQSASR